jgi:hypothetical protein
LHLIYTWAWRQVSLSKLCSQAKAIDRHLLGLSKIAAVSLFRLHKASMLADRHLLGLSKISREPVCVCERVVWR